MGIGDSGDEFSEQAFKALVDTLRDASRWARGNQGQHRHRMKQAWKSARENIRSLVAAEGGDERALPGDVVLWACDKAETDKIRETCAEMEIEFKPGRQRPSGLKPILLPANAKLRGVSQGDLYNPLDPEDERVLGLMEEFSHDAASERLAAVAAASAMQAECKGLYESFEFTPDGPYNASFSFKTLPFDRNGKMIDDCLNAAGIGHEMAQIGEEALDIAFDSRQTPLLESLIENMVEESHISAMDWSRFPEWRREMRIAKIAMAQWARNSRGENIVNLTVPKHRDAQMFSSALNKLGIACAEVGHDSETKSPIVAVDAADLIAKDADLEKFMEGRGVEQYVLDVLEGKEPLLALPAGMGEDAPASLEVTTQISKVEVAGQSRRQSKFAVRKKSAPEADERRAREASRRISSAPTRTVEQKKTQVNTPKPSRGKH